MRAQRQSMMAQILSEEANRRLGAIAAVKPGKAETLENIIIQNAQSGRFQGKVSEEQLVDLLQQVKDVDANAAAPVEKAKHHFEDEDELDLDNMDF